MGMVQRDGSLGKAGVVLGGEKFKIRQFADPTLERAHVGVHGCRPSWCTRSASVGEASSTRTRSTGPPNSSINSASAAK
ncbi:MAG: hypothetical protein Fur0037_22140 [Planctomycetota bacterium]